MVTSPSKNSGLTEYSLFLDIWRESYTWKTKFCDIGTEKIAHDAESSDCDGDW